MAKEKKTKEPLPPKVKEKSAIQKKRKLKTSTTLTNNNVPQHGFSSKICKKNFGESQKSRSHSNLSSEEQPETVTISNNNKPSTSSNTCEDVMEWEPTETEIIRTLHEIRREFPADSNFSIIPGPPQQLLNRSTSVLVHAVIDTNIFLAHLETVKMLVESKEVCSKVQIYVPWMVLQELDYMKTNRENKVKLGLFARKAATFIFEQINNKNQFFRVQTLDEFRSCINLLTDQNADDKILQWCLQLKKEIPTDISLLSNDILFCAKAIACGIQTFQTDKFTQLLPQLLTGQPANSTSLSVTNKPIIVDAPTKNNLNSLNSNPAVTSAYQEQEHLEEEETIDVKLFLQQYEESLVVSLSQLLEYEMKQAYDDEIWLHIVLVKPPWELADIFRCIEKHWIAVFGYVYPRDMREKMDHLHSLWKKIKTSRIVEQKQCEILVESAVSILYLMQRTRKQFHHLLAKSIEGVKDALNQCNLDDAFILDLFTNLWERFNFICGTLSDAVGITHGLQYKAGQAVPSLQEAITGLRMLVPMLSNLEIAMSRFSQNENDSPAALESGAKEMSNCLLSSVNELGLPLKKTTTVALCSALIRFVSNVQHKEKFKIGLEQLRTYIQVLHSVSVRLQ